MQVVEAMHHVTEILDKYKSSFPDNEIERYTAFPFLQILNTYAVPSMYARALISDAKIASLTLYDKSPNAWTRVPPTGTATNTSVQKVQQIRIIRTSPQAQ
eukprot:10835828-Ditylum_brightwellii.AAC.1